MSICHYCHSCTHWKWDNDIITDEGLHISVGHCALQSINCINKAITGNSPPPYYQEIELDEREEVHTL